jgi:hypothetical protein
MTAAELPGMWEEADFTGGATDVDPLGTPELFVVPELPERPAPRTSPTTGRPRWAKYRPKVAAHCDDCLAYIHQNNGQGPAPLKARHKRTAGLSTRLLCDPHAQAQREQDRKATS